MVLNAPLTIRLDDGTTDRHVTQYASGLSFTKVAPGGHQACRFRLNLPRAVFNDLGPQDKCWVYSNTGETIFGAAYLENPTPTDGYGGQVYDISAMGGMALANDESRPLIYVTGDLGQFTSPTVPNVATSVDTSDGNGLERDGSTAPFPGYPRVRTQFNSGQAIASGDVAQASDHEFDRAGFDLGAIYVVVQSGVSDANYRSSVYHNGPPSGGRIDIGVGASGISTGPVSSTLWSGTDFPAGTRQFSFALLRTGAATNISTENVWTAFVDPRVIGRRLDRYGNGLIGSAGLVSATSVLASQVVEDLLGRMLTFCDPATATVDATTFGIDQLAYPDGAKAATVLTDLADYEPDFWWGIGASGATDLHQFWYRQWATEPRYVVSVQDGWRQTGGDVDLCNRIVVYYTDTVGAQQYVEVTAAGLGLTGQGLPVDALGSRVKDADPVTLPPGRGSAATAQQVGEAILRDKINPPLSGTVTVRRRIVDLLTGNEVAPWELEPGWPVLVREPGITLRCTQVDYDDASVAATLTLGTPAPTDQQRLARLARVA